jgi:hypothetical protein
MIRATKPSVRPFIFLTFLCGCSLAFPAAPVRAVGPPASDSRFTYRDIQGKTQSAGIVMKYQPNKIVYPFNKPVSKIDPKLRRAASIAEERAHAHSREKCWHYVKEALLASGAVSSYPQTAYAKEAGRELVSNYGFKKLPVQDPFKAPVGAVLVYGASKGAGHVEIRTESGFASDFRSKIPSPRPLIGVYTKS